MASKKKTKKKDEKKPKAPSPKKVKEPVQPHGPNPNASDETGKPFDEWHDDVKKSFAV